MNLPEHDPDPNLWQRIEAGLETNAQIDRMLHALPQHDPDSRLWGRIEIDLNQTPVIPIGQKPTRMLGAMRWMAAAIVVLISGYWLWQHESTPATERVTVSYSVEKSTQPAPAPTLANPEANRRAEALIARQCAEQRPVCQKPEVHELRNQLVELKQEQARIGQEMATFGADPALMQAQAKIESQRAEVTKELLTLLQS